MRLDPRGGRAAIICMVVAFLIALIMEAIR